jgi:hypothetical protein
MVEEFLLDNLEVPRLARQAVARPERGAVSPALIAAATF